MVRKNYLTLHGIFEIFAPFSNPGFTSDSSHMSLLIIKVVRFLCMFLCKIREVCLCIQWKVRKCVRKLSMFWIYVCKWRTKFRHLIQWDFEESSCDQVCRSRDVKVKKSKIVKIDLPLRLLIRWWIHLFNTIF